MVHIFLKFSSQNRNACILAALIVCALTLPAAAVGESPKAAASSPYNLAPGGKARAVLPEERDEMIRRARVWHEVDVAAMDTLNGPQGEGSYLVGQEVPCRYEEKDPKHPLGGSHKKFPCWDAAGNRLKIKYDPANNSEVFGEVLGSRLMWALGFYADRMYSVDVRCENCPEDPWISSATPRATRLFSPATIQKRLPGDLIAASEDDGWAMSELGKIDPDAGGSTRAEVDAYKLLMVFVNHVDNTANQQALMCPKGDPQCKRPVMYIMDIGATFGGSPAETSFANWSGKARIWKDASRCVADLKGTDPDFIDPRISEAGRKFLADLLVKLSDKQIEGLFKGARVDVLDKLSSPIVDKGGRSRAVSIDDWVRVFKDKRDQIAKASCPS